MKNSNLINKKCIPCQGGVPPLSGDALSNIYKELGGNWTLVDDARIEKDFKFVNFDEALDFTNKIGKIAQIEDHHPDIHLAWGHVKVILWTHKINGLSESDFIFAAKVDGIKT